MEILKKIATFTKDLLQYDEGLIIIARRNFDRVDTTKNFIVIDCINNQPIGKFKNYYGEDELENFTTRYVGSFQILFYGLNALQNSLTWQNMLASESKFTLESALGINIYNTTSHNNLRIEDGTNFDNLYQCDFKVKYDETTQISTLRIDTPVISLLTEAGKVINVTK